MEKEEKQLLLKDLSARLPYGVKCDYEGSVLEIDKLDVTNEEVCGNLIAWYDSWSLEKCKPYLRPMSSMTDEEYKFYKRYFNWYEQSLENMVELIDWLLRHHFDYRGLIDKGLALEAPEGMYNFN